jgi:hypothetical protein
LMKDKNTGQPRFVHFFLKPRYLRDILTDFFPSPLSSNFPFFPFGILFTEVSPS